MSKIGKIIIVIFFSIIGFVLTVYLGLCLVSAKPGMHGYTVTNNTIYLLLSGKDYVKVDENKYLYREGSLYSLIENEYESYRIKCDYYMDAQQMLDGMYESEIVKVCIVSKNGEDLKGGGVHVWSPMVERLFGRGVHSVFYRPYEKFENITERYDRYITEMTQLDYVPDPIRAGAPKTRVFGYEQLDYIETKVYSRKTAIDKYEGADGAVYDYNSDGFLIGFTNNPKILEKANSSQTDMPEKPLSENEVKNIAEEFAKKLYGDRYNGYKYISTANDGRLHSVVFEKRYGGDGFLTGERYVCNILATGEIYSCTMTNPQDMEGFDAGIISHISESDINEMCQRILKDEYNETLKDFKINGAYIKMYGIPVINVLCMVNVENGGKQTEVSCNMTLEPK